MVPVDVDALGAAYWTGNGHKWLCGPKGTAVLWVREDRRDRIHPLVVSHGANEPLAGRTRFRHEFDWVGTSDPTGYLTLPAAIDWMDRCAIPEGGGWPAVMAANHALGLRGRDIVAAALGIEAQQYVISQRRAQGHRIALARPARGQPFADLVVRPARPLLQLGQAGGEAGGQLGDPAVELVGQRLGDLGDGSALAKRRPDAAGARPVETSVQVLHIRRTLSFPHGRPWRARARPVPRGRRTPSRHPQAWEAAVKDP